MTYYPSLALRHLAVGGLQSVRKANCANVLVTSDGGAVIFLGSPDRLVRLKGSASKRD